MNDFSKVQRFFAFGCSFTSYTWYTWADILAYELGVPYYNRGKPGASNPYIAAQVAQMDLSEKFGPGDLVAIMWTSPTRQDIFQPPQHKEWSWQVSGNIYSDNIFNNSTPINEIANSTPPDHFLMRDLVLIKHTQDAVKATGAQCLFMSMCDLNKPPAQFDLGSVSDIEEKILEMFKDPLSKISESFYQRIWQNDLSLIRNTIHNSYQDSHPSILEQMQYISAWFDLSEKTSSWCQNHHDRMMSYIDQTGVIPRKLPIRNEQQPSKKIWR